MDKINKYEIGKYKIYKDKIIKYWYLVTSRKNYQSCNVDNKLLLEMWYWNCDTKMW